METIALKSKKSSAAIGNTSRNETRNERKILY